MAQHVVALAAALSALLAAAGAAGPPEVDVAGGRLRGHWLTSRTGRPIAAFEGVPYAEPPVGDLRFQPPQPARSWSVVRDAVKLGNVCLQKNTYAPGTPAFGEEDCLYLNVYAPETVSRADPLPVMVYIHGGGFLAGNGNEHGPQLLLEQDVVYVNMNYRLGVFGFLSTGDAVVPGNFGLKDQSLALRWVRDNIRMFGGDPNLVTILGESAGAASVHFHTLSPLSKGLFHRAALFSGNALATWAWHGAAKARQQADRLAKMLSCPSEDSQDLHDCVKAKSAAEIVNTADEFMEWHFHPMIPFKPTTEPAGPGAFLDGHPAEVYAAGRGSDVPYLIGFTSHDGCIAAVPILESDENTQRFNKNFNDLLAMMMYADHLPAATKQKVFDAVRLHYFGSEPISKILKLELTELMTDAYFSYATLETIRLQSAGTTSPVFFYELAHASNRTWATVMGAKTATYGMCHGDDLIHVFALKDVFPAAPSEEDQLFSDKWIDILTTFAATGRPTSDSSWKEVHLPGWKAEYAHITARELVMSEEYAPERIRFWDNLPVQLLITSPNRIKDEL